MPKYTSSTTFDALVITYVWIRIFFLILIPLFAIPQFIYLCQRIRRQRTRTIGSERFRSSIQFGPKLITYVCLILFPIFRIADQLCLLYAYPRSGVGSMAWIFGVISTYFLVTEWIFIGCYWVQVIYTFFISTTIIPKNTKRAWVTSWIFTGVFALWMLFILIYGIIKKGAATSMYAYGFFIFLIILGIIICVHGFILVRFLRHQDKSSEEYQNTIEKTLKLSLTLLGFIMVIILRDIIWTALGLSRTSDYRYITYVIVGICEIVQSVIVMIALSNSQLSKVFRFQHTEPTPRYITPTMDYSENTLPRQIIDSNSPNVKGFSTFEDSTTTAGASAIHSSSTAVVELNDFNTNKLDQENGNENENGSESESEIEIGNGNGNGNDQLDLSETVIISSGGGGNDNNSENGNTHNKQNDEMIQVAL